MDIEKQWEIVAFGWYNKENPKYKLNEQKSEQNEGKIHENNWKKKVPDRISNKKKALG